MVVAALLGHPEPAVRWRARVHVLGEDRAWPDLMELSEEVRASARVGALLSLAQPDGTVAGSTNVYDKWQGAHWILATLADIGYPTGDEALLPMRDRVMQKWLAPHYYTDLEVTSRAAAYRKRGVPKIQGRFRRCASQQANALWAVLTLDLADDRVHDLVERLLHWQWPDGGWNCDKNPDADTSSFAETVHCVRALHVYGTRYGEAAAVKAARAAAEVLLSRRLFRRRSDGRVIRPAWLKLHYPAYWKYDVLFGLKVLAAAGLIGDERCAEALDVVESKQLPDGGWRAGGRHYRVSAERRTGHDYVDWGSGRAEPNPWVTTDALAVLAASGRLDVRGAPEAGP